jgi:hypothetical protein
MKKSILRNVCFAVVIILMSGFVTKAQNESFFDTKWENGKVVSKTKYEMGCFGIVEPKFEVKYAYDENGDFLKKEVCAWNPKYVLNDKTGRWDPDYSESNWTPEYCIVQKKDMINNFVYAELLLWNKKLNTYDIPTETMTYQLKDANHFNYLAFTKGNKYEEVANIIKYTVNRNNFYGDAQLYVTQTTDENFITRSEDVYF